MQYPISRQNVHPSYSFKYRGISHFIQKARADRGPSVHLIIASGGNAGLAAATAARAVQARCTVFIPEGVSESTLRLLKGQGAEVVVKGSFYAEAVEVAKDIVRSEENA